MITDRKILFISFFLYFIIVRKSIRSLMKENDGINGNKEYHLIETKKGPFDIISIMDICI